MTKEELKQYIIEAVDAMEATDLEALFPNSGAPDLYTVVHELTGLKGELRKLAQASLKLSGHVQQTLETQIAQQEEFEAQKKAFLENKQQDELDEDFKKLLIGLIAQNDEWERSAAGFNQLPELLLLNYPKFRRLLYAWKKGYDISLQKWNAFVKALGLQATGLPGQAFNHEYHEAVAQKQDPSKKDNEIIETEVMGFFFKGKLIRQAKVIVNKINNK